MRKLFISLAISAFALSSVHSQSLDQILKDHYKASGQEKISKVKTVITKGLMTYVTAGMESAITLYQSRPNKVRMEANILGSKVIQTYNGTTGWMYAPAMGIAEPQEMGDAELRAVLQQVEFDSPLWNYKENGNTVELMGSSDDGAAHKLKLTQVDGQEILLLVDKKSHLIKGTTMVSVMGGAETEVQVDMKDYKTVKGIQTAHYISTKINGEVMVTLAIESIEYNKDIDPAMFEKPSTE
jgi:outer membrane lipoprotein-sorting protein